jgi:hypothetical protein
MPDGLRQGAIEVSHLMKDSRNFPEVAERLRSDAINMNPQEFKRFAQMITLCDQPGNIDLIVGQKNGLPSLTLTDQNVDLLSRKLLRRGETEINGKKSLQQFCTTGDVYPESRR